jgi:hypothetical protein
MPTTFGDKTRAIVYKKEAYKLHESFPVATGVTLHEGEMVELNSAGELIVAVVATAGLRSIGHCIAPKLPNTELVSVVEQLTVAMRGYSTLLGSAGENGLVPGPVKAAAYDTTNNRPTFSGATVTADNMVGWAITPGDLAEEIRVVLK